MEASYVVDLAGFDQGRTDFQEHYCLTGYDTDFGGQDFKIDWTDLYTFLNGFCSVNSISPANVGLRFVHCYDVNNNDLFLRLQLCRLEPTQLTSYGRAIFAINTNPSLWLELKEDTIDTTMNQQLSDPVYLNYFYYSSNPLPNSDPLEKLADDNGQKYVRTIVFPWTQIAQMFADNGNPANAKIHFASCSYTSVYEGDSGIEWPHGLALYLSVGGNALLDNVVNQQAIFENKAADHGSLTPPPLKLTDVYIHPSI